MGIYEEIFEYLPRQGPGSRAVTRQALELAASSLPENPRILDVGCGSGASSLLLAQVSGAHVTAVDKSAFLLDRLSAAAREQGLSTKDRDPPRFHGLPAR